MTHTPKLWSRTLAIAVLWMGVVNGCMLWNTRVQVVQGYGDFASFYTAGTLVRRGLGVDIYNHAAQWKLQQQFASKVELRQGPLPYIRPPYEALLFWVFAYIRFPLAVVLWMVLNLALLAAIPFIVAGERIWNTDYPLWAAGFLLAGTFPGFIDILMGQDAALVVLLFAIAFRQLEARRDARAGATLGLALFKFHLVIPFVAILWIAGRRRVLTGFAAAGAALVGVSAIVVGWRGLAMYPGYLLNLNRREGVGMVYPEVQTNFRGVLALFVGRAPYPGPIHWVLAPIALAGVLYAGLAWRKAGDHLLAEGFGLASITAIVTSYYSREYDFLLIIVPLIAMWVRPQADSGITDKVGRYFEMVGLLLLVLTPVYWFVKIDLRAECLIIVPLIAVAIAWARKLRLAAAEIPPQRKTPLQVAPK